MLDRDPAVARIAGPPSRLYTDSASGMALRLITWTRLKPSGSKDGGQESACHTFTVESAPPENTNRAAERASMHVTEAPWSPIKQPVAGFQRTAAFDTLHALRVWSAEPLAKIVLPSSQLIILMAVTVSW